MGVALKKQWLNKIKLLKTHWAWSLGSKFISNIAFLWNVFPFTPIICSESYRSPAEDLNSVPKFIGYFDIRWQRKRLCISFSTEVSWGQHCRHNCFLNPDASWKFICNWLNTVSKEASVRRIVFFFSRFMIWNRILSNFWIPSKITISYWLNMMHFKGDRSDWLRSCPFVSRCIQRKAMSWTVAICNWL